MSLRPRTHRHTAPSISPPTESQNGYQKLTPTPTAQLPPARHPLKGGRGGVGQGRGYRAVRQRRNLGWESPGRITTADTETQNWNLSRRATTT